MKGKSRRKIIFLKGIQTNRFLGTVLTRFSNYLEAFSDPALDSGFQQPRRRQRPPGRGEDRQPAPFGKAAEATLRLRFYLRSLPEMLFSRFFNI